MFHCSFASASFISYFAWLPPVCLALLIASPSWLSSYSCVGPKPDSFYAVFTDAYQLGKIVANIVNLLITYYILGFFEHFMSHGINLWYIVVTHSIPSLSFSYLKKKEKENVAMYCICEYIYPPKIPVVSGAQKYVCYHTRTVNLVCVP